MKLSVIMVTCGREELFIRACTSVLRELPPQSEVVIVVNGHQSGTVSWLDVVGDPRLRYTVVPRESRCKARNRAVLMASGEVIHIVDDDIVVPPGLLDRVLRAFAHDPELGVLGGPNLTPPDSLWPASLFGAIMTSVFVAPHVRFRYCQAESGRFVASERHLILCNLAFRRSEFQKKLFSDLHSNEENLLLYYLAKGGSKIQYDNLVFVFHERRRTVGSFLRQIFSYGVGRGQQSFVEPKSLSFNFAVPGVCVVLGAWCVIYSQWLGLVLMGVHQIIAWIAAFLSADIRRLKTRLAWAPVLTLLIHASYGVGFWRGFLGMVAEGCFGTRFGGFRGASPKVPAKGFFPASWPRR